MNFSPHVLEDLATTASDVVPKRIWWPISWGCSATADTDRRSDLRYVLIDEF